MRAVVVGQHNLLEETIFANAIFRQALTDNDMAVVWVSPAFDGQFNPARGAGEHFIGMMKALALESGYAELENAPVVPIGHSAMAGFPYQFAAWAPERTLVAISIKGQWPDHRNPGDFDFDNARLGGVPILFINGEYEDANGRAAKAAAFRAKYPRTPLTMLADGGGGHFDFHDRLASYIARYLREIVKYRLPENGPLVSPVALKIIDPTQSGWLYDRWRRDELPKAPPAPLATYAGPKNEAFWAFNGELARTTEEYTQKYQGKLPQLLGYIQNGGTTSIQNSKAHEQVQLKLTPLEDGTTFKIAGTFIDSVPEGRPPGWTGLPIGAPINHASDSGPIDVQVTTGPLQKLNEDTFALRFGRIGFNNTKRGGDVWFQATHEGGTRYKRAVQQALMRIPLVNKTGAEQTISFSSLADQKVAVKSVFLTATSSAGVPVSYYVESGPAFIEGNVLRFSPLPPRAKMPIKITVVAYQWGRPIEPKLKSAAPIAQTFFLGQGPTPTQIAKDKDKAAREVIWQGVAEKIAAISPVTVAMSKGAPRP